jgi:hypothetical protein
MIASDRPTVVVDPHNPHFEYAELLVRELDHSGDHVVGEETDAAWLHVPSNIGAARAYAALLPFARGDPRQIWFFTDYYSVSPGKLSQTPGVGAKYMIGFTDSQSTPLSGGGNYRVKLPPNIPAGNF